MRQFLALPVLLSACGGSTNDVVVAIAPLDRGTLITAEDVEIRSVSGADGGLVYLTEAVGRFACSPVATDAPIFPQSLMFRHDEDGDEVRRCAFDIQERAPLVETIAVSDRTFLPAMTDIATDVCDDGTICVAGRTDRTRLTCIQPDGTQYKWRLSDDEDVVKPQAVACLADRSVVVVTPETRLFHIRPDLGVYNRRWMPESGELFDVVAHPDGGYVVTGNVSGGSLAGHVSDGRRTSFATHYTPNGRIRQTVDLEEHGVGHLGYLQPMDDGVQAVFTPIRKDVMGLTLHPGRDPEVSWTWTGDPNSGAPTSTDTPITPSIWAQNGSTTALVGHIQTDADAMVDTLAVAWMDEGAVTHLYRSGDLNGEELTQSQAAAVRDDGTVVVVGRTIAKRHPGGASEMRRAMRSDAFIAVLRDGALLKWLTLNGPGRHDLTHATFLPDGRLLLVGAAAKETLLDGEPFDTSEDASGTLLWFVDVDAWQPE